MISGKIVLNVKDTILVNCFDRKNFLSRLSLFLFIHYLNFFFLVLWMKGGVGEADVESIIVMGLKIVFQNIGSSYTIKSTSGECWDSKIFSWQLKSTLLWGNRNAAISSRSWIATDLRVTIKFVHGYGTEIWHTRKAFNGKWAILLMHLHRNIANWGRTHHCALCIVPHHANLILKFLSATLKTEKLLCTCIADTLLFYFFGLLHSAYGAQTNCFCHFNIQITSENNF